MNSIDVVLARFKELIASFALSLLTSLVIPTRISYRKPYLLSRLPQVIATESTTATGTVTGRWSFLTLPVVKT